jgi:hypothetical protein
VFDCLPTGKYQIHLIRKIPGSCSVAQNIRGGREPKAIDGSNQVSFGQAPSFLQAMTDAFFLNELFPFKHTDYPNGVSLLFLQKQCRLAVNFEILGESFVIRESGAGVSEPVGW